MLSWLEKHHVPVIVGLVLLSVLVGFGIFWSSRQQSARFDRERAENAANQKALQSQIAALAQDNAAIRSSYAASQAQSAALQIQVQSLSQKVAAARSAAQAKVAPLSTAQVATQIGAQVGAKQGEVTDTPSGVSLTPDAAKLDLTQLLEQASQVSLLQKQNDLLTQQLAQAAKREDLLNTEIENQQTQIVDERDAAASQSKADKAEISSLKASARKRVFIASLIGTAIGVVIRSLF